MRYSDYQRHNLAATINGSSTDVVVAGTPSDLSNLMRLNKPIVCARYDLRDVGEPKLSDLVNQFLDDLGLT